MDASVVASSASCPARCSSEISASSEGLVQLTRNAAAAVRHDVTAQPVRGAGALQHGTQLRGDASIAALICSSVS